jgi:hypothetical protein
MSEDLFLSAKDLFIAARNAATASRLAIVGQCLQPTILAEDELKGAIPGPGGDGRRTAHEAVRDGNCGITGGWIVQQAREEDRKRCSYHRLHPLAAHLRRQCHRA